MNSSSAWEKSSPPTRSSALSRIHQKKWTITANAIKLKFDILPVSWYQDLVHDIQLLMPPKK